MGEREGNRRAFESLVRRQVEHSRMQGRPVTEQAARESAREIARTRDAQMERGDHKRRKR